MQGGLAPAMLAIVERGVLRQPGQAAGLRAEAELRFLEQYPPVRILFGEDEVLVEDGPAQAPDLQVEGSLPDLISLLVAPQLGGVPSPIAARGRAALGLLAQRRSRLRGRLALLRRMLAVVRI